MASLGVIPVFPGTFNCGTLYLYLQQAQECSQQEMVQALCLENCRKIVMKSTNCLRYPQMLESSVALQLAKVFPFVGSVFLRQVVPMPSRPTSSYSELMSMSLPWMEVKEYCRKMHLYSSPGYLSLQRVIGVLASTFEIRKRVLASSENSYLPVQGLDAFMNVPESATVQSTSGFFSRDLTQLLYMKLAIPPAEAPVRSTFSAFAKSYWLEIHLKCDLVLASPLKQRVVSLYEMASLLQPWWWAPSQQKMMTLVHVANLFRSTSVERYPPGESKLSGKFLLLPLSPLLRLQHCSRTSLSVVPLQQPPPTKKMRNFVLSPPSCRQSAGEVPSRHLALGSELWMIFLQGCQAAITHRQRTANSRSKSDLAMNLLRINMRDEVGKISHFLLRKGQRLLGPSISSTDEPSSSSSSSSSCSSSSSSSTSSELSSMFSPPGRSLSLMRASQKASRAMGWLLTNWLRVISLFLPWSSTTKTIPSLPFLTSSTKKSLSSSQCESWFWKISWHGWLTFSYFEFPLDFDRLGSFSFFSAFSSFFSFFSSDGSVGRIFLGLPRPLLGGNGSGVAQGVGQSE